MKINRYSSLLIFTLASITKIYAQQTPVEIIAQPNAKATVEANLENGFAMPDLRWAWNSSNACFPGTQAEKFSGYHQLYRTDLPPNAEMTIRVFPQNKTDNLSLYAYAGSGEYIVPNLPRCQTCEADHSSDYGRNQSPVREVEFNSRGARGPRAIIIGVAGAFGLQAGAYTLEIEMKGGEPPAPKPEQEAIPKYRIESEKGKTLVYEGRLEEGVLMHDLRWAWNSSNACFVEPAAGNFTGRHIQYVTTIPAYSEMTIQLRPADGQAQMSLYAYSIGGDIRYAPDLPGCISCEASFASAYSIDKTTERKVSLRAVTRPYNVVIGVAGANGLTTGEYELSITIR
jgi:hypothetical protein